MPTLEAKHKEFIIKQLDCFEQPSTVQGLLSENFDIEVPVAQVVYNCPDIAQGRNSVKQ